jgi:hypothetical protein
LLPSWTRTRVRVGQSLERRIPQQRSDDQRNREHFDRDYRPEERLRIRHHPFFILHPDLLAVVVAEIMALPKSFMSEILSLRPEKGGSIFENQLSVVKPLLSLIVPSVTTSVNATTTLIVGYKG